MTTCVLFGLGYLLIVGSIIAIGILTANSEKEFLILLFLTLICIGVYLVTPMEFAVAYGKLQLGK